MSCMGTDYNISYGNKDIFSVLNNSSIHLCNSKIGLIGGKKSKTKKTKKIKNKTNKVKSQKKNKKTKNNKKF
jgi:hypothetical protein